MSAQIDQKGAIKLIDAILTDDTRRIQGLTKALAHLGCSCTVKTREIDLDAHECMCRFKQKMQDLQK